MDRRTSPHAGAWTVGGRVPVAFLVLATLAFLSFPILLAGGGGAGSPRLELQVPACVPVGGELNVKRIVSGNLPAGGRFEWKVVGGSGIVRIRTRELDSSIPQDAAKIKGVKPGRVDLVLEYGKIDLTTEYRMWEAP
jgi:hypothetical protein